MKTQLEKHYLTQQVDNYVQKESEKQNSWQNSQILKYF